MLKTVTKSSNKKLGGCSATYRSGSTDMYGTCPSTCPLKPNTGTGVSEIDIDYLTALIDAVPRNGRSWTYTHFSRSQVPVTRRGQTCINVSCDTVEDAIRSTKEGYPTVITLQKEFDAKVDTHGGVKFVRCPAEYREEATCSNCGGDTPLCARHDRDYVVKFTAHGNQHKKVGAIESGGCYGSSGPVAIQWRNTTKQPQVKSDTEVLKDWVSSLPDGSMVRHHVVGDIGL